MNIVLFSLIFQWLILNYHKRMQIAGNQFERKDRYCHLNQLLAFDVFCLKDRIIKTDG